MSLIRGTINLTLISLNLIFWTFPLLFLSLLKILFKRVPFIKETVHKGMDLIYQLAVAFNEVLLLKTGQVKLIIEGEVKEIKDRNLLVISNHQSFADIFIIQMLLYKKLPPLKFLVKWEMIYFPVVGTICWAYDYPFIKRPGPKTTLDERKQTLEKLQKSLGKHSGHSSYINFLEGKRIGKRAAHDSSKFNHLLNPKTSGMDLILKMNQGRLQDILDITIHYPNKGPSIFWDFLSGNLNPIHIRFQTDKVENIFKNDPSGSIEDLKSWVWKKWDEKDEYLTKKNLS